VLEIKDNKNHNFFVPNLLTTFFQNCIYSTNIKKKLPKMSYNNTQWLHGTFKLELQYESVDIYSGEKTYLHT
jgi:hypothetical protein